MRRQTVSKSTTIEYPLYNVCYCRNNGQIKEVSKRVSLKDGIAAIKRFDRMICCHGKLVKDIAYMFLKPVKEIRITET